MIWRQFRLRFLRSAISSVALFLMVDFIPHGVLLAGQAESSAIGGLTVECITPDGKMKEVSKTGIALGPENSACRIDGAAIDYALGAGETTFIITLPQNATRDGLTFVNENVEACGELRIAVSDSALPANSPSWTEVDGIIPFAHKRLFKLSMLGVEPKFVRLSFHVENLRDDSSNRGDSRISRTFKSSALADAIESPFANAHSSHSGVLASLSSVVTPLSSGENQ